MSEPSGLSGAASNKRASDAGGWPRAICALLFPEATPQELHTLVEVKPYTMTSPERLWALIQAVRYVHLRPIEGDVVECGVWRGGSSMAAALALKSMGDTARQLWLFDTFEGMTKPSSDDRSIESGEPAITKWMQTQDRRGCLRLVLGVGRGRRREHGSGRDIRASVSG